MAGAPSFRTIAMVELDGTDERRSNFSSRKLSTKSNSGVPARGHLERTSLCGNWLPVASSGTKKWECCARVAMTLWSSSPKLWCFPFVHNSHCQKEWVIWGPDMPMFFLNSTGAEEISASGTSYLNRTEAGSGVSYVSVMWICVFICPILLRQQTSRSWWLTSWSLAWSLIRWSWWVDVRLMFVFKTHSFCHRLASSRPTRDRGS